MLATAYADGRIERDEHDERVAVAARARTLGELPPLVADLVPTRPATRPPTSLAHASHDDLEHLAVERWVDQRRSATFFFLGTTVLGWGVFFASEDNFAWLLVVNALALLHLARVLMSREALVRTELRRLERKQARQQKWPLQLPPGPWRP